MLAIICFLFDSKLANLITLDAENNDGIMLDTLSEVVPDILHSLID